MSVIMHEETLSCLGLRAEIHLSSLNPCWFLLCQFQMKCCEFPRQSLPRPRCFLPSEDISFPRAICLSTLPYQETINRTICGLVTSPVIPPNQIMTNWKKQGE